MSGRTRPNRAMLGFALGFGMGTGFIWLLGQLVRLGVGRWMSRYAR